MGPRCTILAGPNGSGKSTVHERLGAPGAFVNADVVARRLSPGRPESAALQAGREVLATLDRLLADGTDFVYETTLSSAQSLAVMRRARSAGFEVSLVFVVLSSADLNVMRVAQRVASGGHDIPEAVVRRRHDGAMSRLRQAVPLADFVVVFDNSFDAPILVAGIEHGRLVEGALDANRVMHVTVADALAEALRMDVADVFRRRCRGGWAPTRVGAATQGSTRIPVGRGSRALSSRRTATSHHPVPFGHHP